MIFIFESGAHCRQIGNDATGDCWRKIASLSDPDSKQKL
jgi:hypothetical protein